MPAAFMPEIIDSGKPKEIQTAMRSALRASAKVLHDKDVYFLAAANVLLADNARVSLFIVSKLEAETKAWELKLKAKKPSALVTGQCKLETKDGATVKVALGKVKGDRKAALKAAELAFRGDTKLTASDGLAKA